MIYTCTMNPSVDYQVASASIQLGTLNRVQDTAFYPGGKGINVSRVLQHLGMKSIALGFTGGFTGNFIQESLHQAGILTDFVQHAGPTRINVKLKTDESETEINGSGAFISEAEQQQLVQKIKALDERDYLVISGSLPASVPFQLYEDMVKQCSANGVKQVLDIPSRSLVDLLVYRPFLTKPNIEELEDMLGKDITTTAEAIAGAKQLVQQGAVHVIVSMGAAGAILVNQDGVWQAATPKGELKSSVGAGDSLVAGFLSTYIRCDDISEAFQYGVASGSATAFSDDLCTKQEADRLYPLVQMMNGGKES